MTGTSDPLAALLQETGEAHHHAFLATDGADPDWPLWYATYLHDRLGDLLTPLPTRSELVYLLITAERAHRAAGEAAPPWPAFYASILRQGMDAA